jgi:uncharacterized protein YdaU (DUF1376 family)
MKDTKPKGRAPAFQFYADDFLAGTMTMTNEERGAYISLLCLQWSKGCVTELDIQRICLGMPTHCQGICQSKFQLGDDGNYRNSRLEVERSKQKERSQKQSDIANLRWNKNAKALPTHYQEDAEAYAKSVPEVCFPSPSPSPIQDTKKEKALSPDLEAFRLRIGAMVRRRNDTRWSSKEIKALKEVFELNTPEDDILLVEARYKSKDPYLRRDAMALLNNWNGEVDKVRSGLLPGIGESRVAATSTNIEDYQ